MDLGTGTREPTLTQEAFPNLAAVCLSPVEVLLERGRVPVFLAATARLARDYPTLPVLANLIGPTSTAAALVAPLAFIKGLRKERERAHQVVTSVTRFLCGMATRLIEHGADVIVIHDDTATPALLGPDLFWEFTAPICPC